MIMKSFLPVRHGLRHFCACAIVLAAVSAALWAAPFSRLFTYTQPDGTVILLHGRGDEFQSVFETLDGYTVLFDGSTRAHHYAAASSDGGRLVPTGLLVGKGDPAALGLPKHLRFPREIAERQYLARRAEWEQGTGLARRWAALKALTSVSPPNPKIPPKFPTTGTRVGICLPVCFKDSPPDSEIKPSIDEIRNYYSGETDSIKAYFLHNSNGKLSISHNVSAKWIRLSREKSYYDDPTKKYSTQGTLLINEALDVLTKNPTEYGLTDLLKNVTTDGSGDVDSVSIIYYGASLNIDDKALYPHQGSRDEPLTLGSGKKIKDYALTDCGRNFNLATMCHEIGHMVCSFPDLYRNSIVEGGDRLSGAGAFCLMGLGDEVSELVPTQFCAYLKYKAGWATAAPPAETKVTLNALRAAGTRFNQFLKFPRGGSDAAKEYFLVESRYKSGWDQYLPGSGMVIYYVDEGGGNLEPKVDPRWSTARYECMVMEADGDFLLLKDKKSLGQASDFFYRGNGAATYTNTFGDSSTPNSKWRDGTSSGLKLSDFSDLGSSMSLTVVSATQLSISGVSNAGGASGPPESSGARAEDISPSANTHHLHAGLPFKVKVVSRDAAGDPTDVKMDTLVSLSLRAGTGRLGGNLSGTIPAGTSSVTISGVTYSKAEKGIVLAVTMVSGDALAPGESDLLEEDAAPWLSIIRVNDDDNPTAGVPFDVVVQAQDESEKPLPVKTETQVSIALADGTGLLGGTLTGTIPAGASTVTLSGATYSKAEIDVQLCATVTRGDALSDGDSAPFDVLINSFRSLVPLTLSGGAATALKTSGSGSVPRVGYASAGVAEGAVPYGVAVFSFRNNGIVVSEAAVPASPPTRSARVFIECRTAAAGGVDIDTGIALVNSGASAARLTFTLKDKAGAILATGTGSVSAGWQFAKFVSQLKEVAPAFNLPDNFRTAIGYGSLDVASDVPVSVTALRLSVNQRSETLLTSTPIADLTQALSAGPLYFPQFADGGGYRTTFVLLNTSGSVETGRLLMFGDTGAPVVVNPVGGTRASSFAYAIPPGGTFVLQTDGVPAEASVGWAQVLPDAGTASPVGAGIFSLAQGGILITESGIPAATPTTRARIYIDQSGGHSTGLAMANPGSSDLSVSLKACQLDGKPVAGAGGDPVLLPRNGHAAAFVSQLLSGLPADFKGVLEISSPSALAALTLRALINVRGNFLLTAFPIADAMQPAPAPVIFPQIADGGGYVTEFILLSAGSPASVTLRFYGQDGKPLAIGN